MAKTSLGKIGLTPKGEYNNVTEYKRLDLVTYQGSSYICLKECVGKSVTNETYWQLSAHQGDKPVNGVDYNTETEKQTFKEEIITDGKTEIDTYTITKTNESKDKLDSYTNTKKTELDTKKTDLETNLTNTKDALINEIETTQQGFDTNVSNKTTEFNQNAEQKTNDFNANTTSKIEEFNTNASTQVDTFNLNVTEQTSTFNTNAEQKIIDFNATVGSYNTRITDLEEITEKQNNTIDDLLQELKELEIENEGHILVNDSANFSASLEISGNSYQTTTSIENGDEYNSPSLEYPSEIQSVKGNYNLKIQNKNLINLNNLMASKTSNGITYTKHSDGTFDIVGTATSTVTFTLVGLRDSIISGNNYYFYCSEPYHANTFNLCIVMKGTTQKYLLANKVTSAVAPENITEAPLNFYIPSGYTVNAKNVKIMLVESSIADDNYIEHKEQTMDLNLGDIELNKVEDTSDYFDISYTEENFYKKITNIDLVKNISKIESYNGEEITTNYLSTTGGLDTGASVLYINPTPESIQITDETLISQIEALLNIKTYQGITHITIKGDNLNSNLKLTYKQSNKIKIDRLEAKIDELQAMILANEEV